MGFQIEYVSSNVFQRRVKIFDECGGGYFSTTNGTIKSPSHPNNYPANEDCIYTIWQPTRTVIILNFLSMDTEELYDYIEIRDGNSADSLLLDQLSGNDIPAPIQSSLNYLWIK